MDDRVRHEDFSVVSSFDKSPIQQNGHILMDALHVTAELGCEPSQAEGAQGLQPLNQLPAP